MNDLNNNTGGKDDDINDILNEVLQDDAIEPIGEDVLPDLSEPEDTGAATDDELTDASEAEPEQPQKPPFFELYDWLQLIIGSLAVIVLVFALFIRIIGVTGPSMVPTLNDGDRIVISRLFYTPQRGDIVVLRKEEFMAEPIVKRVIAIAGDTIDINFDTGVVTLNGNVLDEPYISAPTTNRDEVQFPVTVPEGHIFVLGDNRPKSRDSRDSSLGVVDTRYIIGKVLFRVFPLNAFGAPK